MTSVLSEWDRLRTAYRLTMPRPLVFGNGNVLVGIDDHYCIRDFYYPQVGLYNHLNGHRLAMGLWVNGKFAWTDSEGWHYNLAYLPGTLVGNSRIVHSGLGVQIDIREAVLPRSDDFVRAIRVTNLLPVAAEVRIFFSHDLRIMESDIGDTAFYNPFLDGMVHYKGSQFFLFGGSTANEGLEQYATGIKGFGGLEGTWRDAEDGTLSMNPISQGSVDSTFSLRLHLDPAQESTAYYWAICGRKLEDVVHSYHQLVDRGWSEALDDATRYSAAYSSEIDTCLVGLPEDLIEPAKRSLLTIRTQTDNGGAILAANDSDIMKTNRANYSFMWPRDGAFVSTVYDELGIRQPARRFFEFCKRILPSDRPVLHQKYMADGSIGATWHPWIIDGKPEAPFQEDETALTLHALWQHFNLGGDFEFLDDLFEPFVLPVARFLEHYRDPGTKLPLPSYDLWEERRGVHTFTTAAVVAGLNAAANIAAAVGSREADRFRIAASETQEAMVKHLFDEERGVFFRRLSVQSTGTHVPDSTVDSSVLHSLFLGVIDPNGPMADSIIEVVRNKLWVQTEIGGMARYEGDYYFRVDKDLPGNPWIICTLWLAQALILRAHQPVDLQEPLELLRWVSDRGGSTGILPEQVDPFTGRPLSVSPLTWSHAEFLQTSLDWAQRNLALA